MRYHFTLVYHKWQSYDVWFLRYEVQLKIFFVILSHFLLFYPNNNPKNQKFWKNEEKKCLGISSFYTSVSKIMTISYTFPDIYHMTDLIIFHFGLIFFSQLTAQKIYTKKKWKKTTGDIINLYKCTKNHVCCTVLLKLSVMDVTVVIHFWLFLLFYPTHNLKIQKILRII